MHRESLAYSTSNPWWSRARLWRVHSRTPAQYASVQPHNRYSKIHQRGRVHLHVLVELAIVIVLIEISGVQSRIEERNGASAEITYFSAS